MELVTGFAGQAHVDPIDMAHVNAVAFGHDAYLLDTQNKLEPTLETANKLVVDTGDLMIQGHHFTVVQSEEIALQSGVSGQKRNALVCARYEKAEGTGVESASWIVKYGTATTGTPADPSVITGNILDGVDSVHDEPIFRIEYDGITPGDPILLVPEFQSNAKFRDSISQEIGTSGVWHYIKHANGFAEAYTGKDDTGTFNGWSFANKWDYSYIGGKGSGYQSTPEIDLPFTFIEVYDFGIVATTGNGSTSCTAMPTGSYSSQMGGSVTKFPGFFLVRPSQDTTPTNLNVFRYIRGRWK
jgi:hypothetical protein